MSCATEAGLASMPLNTACGGASSAPSASCFSGSRSLPTMDANGLFRSYELSSELARIGLHAVEVDPDRKLAWVNSVCILFLLIGIVGSRPASIRIKPLPPVEEANEIGRAHV